MATTFVLKRKYFADPNQQQGEKKKGMSTGKKLAIAGGALALGATALGVHGAGGFNKQGLQNFAANFKKGGNGLRGVGANIKSGAGKVTQSAGNFVKNTADKMGDKFAASGKNGAFNAANSVSKFGQTISNAGSKLI